MTERMSDDRVFGLWREIFNDEHDLDDITSLKIDHKRAREEAVRLERKVDIGYATIESHVREIQAIGPVLQTLKRSGLSIEDIEWLHRGGAEMLPDAEEPHTSDAALKACDALLGEMARMQVNDWPGECFAELRNRYDDANHLVHEEFN